MIAHQDPSVSTTGASPSLAFTRAELQVFLAAVAVMICARFPAFFYAHSVDDYSFNTSLRPIYHYFPMTFGDGRFGAGLLLAVLHALGLRQGTTPAVSALLAALAAAWTAILICRLWHAGPSRVTTAAIVGVLTLHPYLADSSTFQVITLINAMAFLAAVLALYFVAERPGLALPVTLIVLSCSIYQAAVAYFLVAALAATLLDMVVETDRASRLRSGWRLLARSLAALAVALPVYLAANWLAMAVSGMRKGRFGIIGPSMLPGRIGQVMELLKTVFFREEPVMPLLPKLLLLGVACLTAAAVAVRLWKRREDARWRLPVLAGIPLTLAVLAIASVGVVAAAVDWWPAPRTLQQFALFWAFILLAGLETAGPRLRAVLLAAAAVLCLSFAGMTNHILDDRLRANVRDSLETERLLSRLEAMPGFGSVESLAIVGGHWTWPSALDTAYYDGNISSMTHPWSKVIFIDDVTGYAFKGPTQAMIDAAGAYCAAAPVWPAEQSLAIRGDFAIVCLARQ